MHSTCRLLDLFFEKRTNDFAQTEQAERLFSLEIVCVVYLFFVTELVKLWNEDVFRKFVPDFRTVK